MSAVNVDLSPLDAVHEQHSNAGHALFAACAAELFPCDVLAYAVLERSLNLIKAFRSIVNDGGYSAAMGLLRMQLDNILRFHGIATSKAPHDVAREVLNGKPLSKIKDRSGAVMRDARLIEALQKKNPQIKGIYELASGYIHLSREHYLQFNARCPLKEDGTRDFSIGDDEDHIPFGHKEELVKGFVIISRGIPRMVQEWSEVRHLSGSNEELKAHFSKSV